MSMTGSHNALLVGLSITIAVVASFTALDLAARMRASVGSSRNLWLAGASLVLGGGIWSMHFVAMLAFSMPHMTIGYDLRLTLLSLVLAIAFTILGFAVMERWRTRSGLVLAGTLMGLGVAAMHYVGMAAMRMNIDLRYETGWVVLSVMIAIGAAIAALWLASREQRLPARLVAALLMGMAISGMHYAGMRAAIFQATAHADTAMASESVSQTNLAVGVTAVTMMILLAGWGAAALDRRLSLAARREARTALRLRLAEALRDIGTDEALHETAALMGAHFGVERVGYGELDPVAGILSYQICWTDGSVPALLGTYRLAAFGEKIVADLLAGRTVAIEDLLNAGLTKEALDRPVVTRAILIVPFLQEGRLRSLAYLNNRDPRRWTADEIAFLEEIAERTRQVIARADAEKRLRELNETLEQRVLEAVSERELLAAVVDNTSASVMVCDLDLTILALNSAQRTEFKRIYGRECRPGQNLLDLLSDYPEHQEMIHGHWKRALGGERFLLVDEFGDAAYDQAHFEVHFHPMRNPVGMVTGAFLTAYDVSDRVRAQRDLEMAQEALRQSQKMEAMGQLTGGVAHDFNNLLTPILGTLDLLQRKGVGGERETRLVAGAFQSAERAKLLVQRLLAFARRQPLQAVPVDIHKLVTGMADLVSSTTGPQIRVVVDASPDLPFARADANQLEMALLNLSVNARDAMPDGGTLRISALSEKLSLAKGDLKAGDYIVISVADTGLGMDEATVARAVEPFFSTKGIGKGTGLGLSMAHGLASQLGGALHIASRPGLGTNVELWLPQASRGGEPVQILPAATASLKSGTVLLVDDEAHVRASTGEMLRELGYSVVEVESGEEAVAYLDRGRPLDLLLTDHLMPGITGADLVERVRTARPDIPVLLISGYAELEGIAANIPRLAKPFRKDELAESLAIL